MNAEQEGLPLSGKDETEAYRPGDDPECEATSKVEALAIEYLDRVSAGEHPNTESFLQQLSTDEERSELEELLRYAMTVESVLPPVIEVGENLGPYELKEEFKAGAMGRVFRAYDRNLNREVAVKVLPPHHGGPMFRQAFQNEAQSLARLDHPNIVGIHEAGAVKGIDYLVMDFVDGRSLADVLESLSDRALDRLSGSHLTEAIGRPPADGRDDLSEKDWYRTAAKVMRRITRGLEAAHASNLLHRDLKPSNIILRGGGDPVVLDFGLARASDRPVGDMTEGLYGTAPYMAPEQVRTGKTGASPLTDVYQLGLILYEMLTLRRAFPGDSVSDVTMKVGKGVFLWPRKINPDIPADLEAICLKATDVVPTHRYRNVTELRVDLERFLDGRPTMARPPTALRKAAVVLRRHRGLAAILLALVSGGLLTWAMARPTPKLVSVVGLTMRGLTTAEGTDTSGYRLTSLRNGDIVNPGEYIGFSAELERPATLYCMSFVAEKGQVKAVRPLPPITLEEIRDDRWQQPLGRRWDSGKHNFMVSVVESKPDRHIAADSRSWNEGLWVFASENDPEWVSRWLEELATEADQWDETIPYEDAIARLQSIQDQVGRGGSIAGDANLTRLVQELPSLDLQNEEDWTLDDPDLEVLNFVAQR